MILYHGSNICIDIPRIIEPNRNLDFGKGFYLTANIEQARDFAEKVVSRRKEGRPVVSVYETDYDAIKSKLKILAFPEPNEAWLNFIADNRRGAYAGEKYDVITGPIANDDVYTTLGLYLEGLYDLEEAMRRLRIKKLYNQTVFTTGAALGYLIFKGEIQNG